MPFVITEPCVGVKDKACVGVCPVDCIYDFDGEPQLYIHPDECIECGACQPVCPVSAIFMDAEVPADQASYTELNAEKSRALKG
ncbi:MAG: 4Fe-4S ferredoxin iron-sulfur binding domain protein [Vampirovibrio sp.]|jgi:NAD-dependent dihydropyrimidine dehydrogenase PreA subunit|nr:4Fe-4S ferredoxin iron-sulfur binding domain protein [Vampirovibrio sp.]